MLRTQKVPWHESHSTEELNYELKTKDYDRVCFRKQSYYFAKPSETTKQLHLVSDSCPFLFLFLISFFPYLFPSIRVMVILRAELIGPLKAEKQLLLPSLPTHYGVQYLNSSIYQKALENYCLSIRNLSSTNTPGVKRELSSRSTGASGT